MTASNAKRTATLAEAQANLTATQRMLLEKLRALRATEQQRIRAATAPTRQTVARALDGGIPAKVLADTLGVSRARVYQMRDEAATR